LRSIGLKVARKVFINDIVSGLVMSIVTVPGALANGLLAGVNPVYGIYSVIAGTTVAAIFTSSVIMNVDSTSATSIATGTFIAGITSDEQLGYLVVLGILVGLFMVTFGILRLGFMIRFISNSVMTGFLSGLGVLTILGQLGDLTNYYSEAPNRVFRLFDTIINWKEIDPATLFVGMITIAIIILLSKTRFERYSFAIALIITTLMTLFPPFESVTVVGDSTEIPRGLPLPNLPQLSLIPKLLLPALTISIIALVQGAGVSQSKPNPDGNYPNTSRDFIGQGAGNIATGIFGGIPVGGSLSGTTLIQSLGGISRWANIFTGIFTVIIFLIFAPLIEILPLPVLAAMLVVVGISMINSHRLRTVWNTGPVPATVTTITFVATLFLELQFAVLIGVILTFLLYIYKSAEAVRIERINPLENGTFVESEAPANLPSGEIVILQPIGSLFFAGAIEFEEELPNVGEASGSVVIIRLRDRDEVGSTFIHIIERYAKKLQEYNNKLMLEGLNNRVLEQLEKTDILDLIGKDNVFPAHPTFGVAVREALVTAQEWIMNQNTQNNSLNSERNKLD